MAVQVICYELRLATLEVEAAGSTGNTAGDERGNGILSTGHLEQVLTDSGFLDPDNPRTLMRRLRRLFIKSQPDQNEINILRGILTSFARALERNPRP